MDNWFSFAWCRDCWWLLLLLFCVAVPLCTSHNFHKTTEKYLIKIIFRFYNGSDRDSWPWFICFLPLNNNNSNNNITVPTQSSLRYCQPLSRFFLILRLEKKHPVLFISLLTCFPSVTTKECWSVSYGSSLTDWQLFSLFILNIFLLEGLHTYWQYQHLLSVYAFCSCAVFESF